MQGLGNDYIYINCLEQDIDQAGPLARRLSDRHFGIGSDGLVLIKRSDKADFRMDMYNSDGSQAQMCGNAIRCVGKYLFDNRITDKTTLHIETLAGIKILQLNVQDGKVATVRVNMGEPILESAQIPVQWDGPQMVDQPVEIDGQIWNMTAVSMGNPHVVIFIDDVEHLSIEQIGPIIEHHPLFPERVNVEFVEVQDNTILRMRVWERGAGETMACGTGSCAALVAASICGLCGDTATVRLNGGDLLIEWDKTSNHIFMSGPAELVFEGEIEL